MRVLRLFNEDEGKNFLKKEQRSKSEELSLLGISGICNLLAAIKTAKYYEMNENDVIFTIFTDSSDLYQSRLRELEEERGKYSTMQAAKDFAGPLEHQSIEYFKELSYYDRKAIHNLKYFTWVEQQGRSSDELNAQWNQDFWTSMFEDEVKEFDTLIGEFNQ
jgi:beta-galactosidase GanA